MERQSLLYRDEHLIAVNKPSGLATHRGWAPERDTALTRARDMLGQRVHLPHRLDRGTSGALLFALDEQTHRALAASFEAQQVHKRYLALVRGHAPASGTIDHAIRDKGQAEGRPAISDYQLLGHSPVERCSLLQVEPRTGRPHQIRRHLKHISHPLLGDTRYGKGALNRHYREHHGLHRLALHAVTLTFAHPHSGEPVTVHAPLPEDFAEVLDRLGLMAPDLQL
ncbi:MAG: pseudouridine synthase [Myxococcales bacterium]|nr:pseudouridine synthase [Myxococcales bacterium]